MTENVRYACNVEIGFDLCMHPNVTSHLQADAMPVQAVAAKTEAEPACKSDQAVHDVKLGAHIDAFTHGRFNGQGIGQEDVKAMLKSPEFTTKEKAELNAIGLLIPRVQELFHTPDVTRAKMGAAIAFDCPEKK